MMFCESPAVTLPVFKNSSQFKEAVKMDLHVSHYSPEGTAP